MKPAQATLTRSLLSLARQMARAQRRQLRTSAVAAAAALLLAGLVLPAPRAAAAFSWPANSSACSLPAQLRSLAPVPLGVVFMLLFGLGSVAGMAIFSAVIAVPLAYTATTLTWASRGLQALAGIIAMGIGLHIMVETGAVLFG